MLSEKKTDLNEVKHIYGYINISQRGNTLKFFLSSPEDMLIDFREGGKGGEERG